MINYKKKRKERKKYLRDKYNKTVIIVTHDISLIQKLSLPSWDQATQ